MKSISLIKPYLVENRIVVFWGLVCLITVDFLQLCIPRIIKWAVDDLTALDISTGKLLMYAVYIATAGILIGVFRYFWRRFLLGVSRGVEEGLRNQLFSHLQILSASYFDQAKTGDLMAHATNDIMHIRMAIGMGMVALTDAIILGAATIGFMAYINVRLTVLVLIPMPLIILGTRFFSKKMHRRYTQVQAAFADITESAREQFAGIKIIKAYNRQKESNTKFDNISRDYIEKNLKLVKITGSFFPLMIFFSNLSMAIVLFLGGRQTILRNITPGDFVAFISYLELITWPMMAIGWVTNLIQRGNASLDRINRILKTAPHIQNRKDARRLTAPDGNIAFENVYFTYHHAEQNETTDKRIPDDDIRRWVLSGVDVQLSKGETLGIVGPPGAGKSTLLYLIPRLYDVCRGRILMDGTDIRKLHLEDLRFQISFVPQEPFLFAGTIRDNILFENESVDDKRLKKACKSAAIYDTIINFSQGFDTMVGEKGIILSGGQKQRICLARAFLQDKPILLLDDPISQVDLETGAVITRSIKNMSREKTTIIVSHRLSALNFADRIIVLTNGIIQAAGSHEQLMKTNDYYAKTYRLQEIEETFHAS
jgi:ATP-binding cassette subfamily B protein